MLVNVKVEEEEKEVELIILKFDKEVYDFGKIKFGFENICVFKVINMGNVLLIIYNMGVSCGCMIFKKLEKFILFGKLDIIEVGFKLVFIGDVEKIVIV